ncbi:uncharacterized protein [Scyliorhinus torazame]|uniref:uncharacterized protein n=1 Tax=Scyliorhinus torazame TaxID=75743 RepID=UPI003B5BDD01
MYQCCQRLHCVRLIILGPSGYSLTSNLVPTGMSVRQSPSAGLAVLSIVRKPTPDCGFLQKMISVSSATLNDSARPYSAAWKSQSRAAAGDFPSSSIWSQPSVVQGQGLSGVMRPASALSPGGAPSRFRQLQGDLVRKRKECEELKKTNNWLAKELQVEKVLLRSESERTMRNLRVLNQEMRATIKEVVVMGGFGKCSLRPTLPVSNAMGDFTEEEREEEETSCSPADIRLQEEIVHLQDKLTDVQHRLTQTEQNYLESKSFLDRRTRENELKLAEIRNLEFERDKEVLRRKELLKEVSQLKDREAVLRRVAVVAEQASDEASQLQYETERYRRLAEYEREEKSKECELWRQKHDFLSDILGSQDEEKAKRKNKACQAKLQTYLLCRAECDQRLSIAKTNNGIPRSFVEGEAAHFTDTDDWHHMITPERFRYRKASPGCEDQTQSYFSDLTPVEHKEISSPSKGRKIVNYFWLPADNGD